MPDFYPSKRLHIKILRQAGLVVLEVAVQDRRLLSAADRPPGVQGVVPRTLEQPAAHRPAHGLQGTVLHLSPVGKSGERGKAALGAAVWTPPPSRDRASAAIRKRLLTLVFMAETPSFPSYAFTISEYRGGFPAGA